MSLCGVITWSPDLVEMGVCEIVSVRFCQLLCPCFSGSSASGFRREWQRWALERSPFLWGHRTMIWNWDLSSVSSVSMSIFSSSSSYNRRSTSALHHSLSPSPFGRNSILYPSTLFFVIWLGIMLSLMMPFCEQWTWPSRWGNKRRRWVGVIIQVRRTLMVCGDTRIVLQMDLSAAAFLRLHFSVCTALSVTSFYRRYSGELVVLQNPHSSGNFLNSLFLQNNYLVLLLCGPLSLTPFSFIPGTRGCVLAK